MTRAVRRAAMPRGLALAAGLMLISCEPLGNNPSGIVDLPATTTQIDAGRARNAQLASATSLDDIPEYTGAPDPQGRWPARLASGQIIYRAESTLEVGSEGPYAVVGPQGGN